MLCYVFFVPRAAVVGPALRVGGDHDAGRQLVFSDRLDQLLRRMPGKARLRPFVLILRDLIPYAHFVSVPATPCVREVEHLTEIGIQIGFAQDAERFITIVLPKILAIPLAGRCPVHAYRLYRVELAEVLEPGLKMTPGLLDVAVAEAHILVVVADLVAQTNDGLDHGRDVALFAAAEVIGRFRSDRRFYLRGLEAVERTGIDVVAQDNIFVVMT